MNDYLDHNELGLAFDVLAGLDQLIAQGIDRRRKELTDLDDLRGGLEGGI